MHEATFRLDEAGPYAEATASTDTAIELWCNDHCDMLDVKGGKLEWMRDRIEAVAGVQEQVDGQNEFVVITESCLKEHEEPTIEPTLRRHNCLLMPPIRYEDGSKFCRVIALDPANLTTVFHDLNEQFVVDVVAKRELDTVGRNVPLLLLADSLPTLSERQRDALKTAASMGYYDIPRGTTTEKIGETMRLNRRTVEGHLRRAENKLVEGFLEVLRL